MMGVQIEAQIPYSCKWLILFYLGFLGLWVVVTSMNFKLVLSV